MLSRSIPKRLAGRAALAVWLALAAGEARSAIPPEPATHTVYLDSREQDSRVIGWRLNVTPQAVPFTKEPDWGGRNICRGRINSVFRDVERPGAAPARSIDLPFAWDYKRGKLYLDTNRNGDLAEETVYSTEPTSGNYFYQTFTNIHLVFDAQPS
ncbi:MAG TPA: hypothetical protein VJA21_19810, partial [Verrucomicrobiae bacterium]